MAFVQLNVSNFRNLASVTCSPLAKGLNFFYGDNGSGKTSLLEAVYYLNVGRSFRSSKFDRIIHHTADRFSLFAHILQENQKIPVGIERELHTEAKIRIAGKDVQSAAELATLSPVLLINSHCHHLLDSVPVFRRKYLDWGVFYLNPAFLTVWRQFARIMKQRNAALKARASSAELDSWSHELLAPAEELDVMRQEHANKLVPLINSLLTELWQAPELTIDYFRGWDRNSSFSAALERSLEKDRKLGFTQPGPHRADVKVAVNGVPAKDILSRGQQKLLVCAMILAQGMLVHHCADKQPVYLIDDLPSELDLASKTKLMALLAKQEAQVFVTAVERDCLDTLLDQTEVKMFHVEHGNINAVEAASKIEFVE